MPTECAKKLRTTGENALPNPISYVAGEPLKNEHFFVVAAGASVTGMEALYTFIDTLNSFKGLACVLVLSGESINKSLLKDLNKKSLFRVQQVHEGMALLPGNLYIVPQQIRITLENNLFHILDEPINRFNMPVDACLAALAIALKDRCMAVLFAGLGEDGIRGARAVKEEGGFVLSQDAESAAEAGLSISDMLRSVCDRVLPPHLLVEEVARYLQEPPSFGKEAVYALDDEPLLNQIYRTLKTASKIDFTYYKLGTLQRRIMRRMTKFHTKSLADYVDFLLSDEEEVQELTKDILIGVTSFFRDPECFEALRQNALLPLLRETPQSETLRIWVAGCSTGEEAYTMAILLDECQQELGISRDVKIFATDVNTESIKIASKGVYSETIARDVTPERLEKYFFHRSNQYHVAKSIRKNCVFSPHNLFVNPPFGQLHLISYRNVLIYFQPILQKTIFSTFHSVLKPDGYLFLGKSEHLCDQLDAFTPVSIAEKVFRHNMFGRISGDVLPRGGQAATLFPVDAPPQKSIPSTGKEVLEEAMPQILESLAKACAVVNELDEVEHLSGAFEPFIRLSSGAASKKLGSLLIPELKLPVSSILRESRQQMAVVTKSNIAITSNSVCSITAIPLRDSKGRLMLLTAILLAPESIALAQESFGPVRETTEQSQQGQQNYQPDMAALKRIDELEDELRNLKSSLEYNVSELQTVNEELQTTNEEMHTSNEELQISNEELQSVNEELFTVNAEYQEKLEEVLVLNDDMSNFLNSTLIGIVYVDLAMNIRKYTDYVSREFDVTACDIGRSVRYFLHKFESEELIDEVWHVATSLIPLQREVCTSEGKSYLLRVSPYRSVNDAIKGIVLSVADIGELKNAYSQIEKLSYAIEQIPIGVTLTNVDGRVEYVNPKFTAISGYTAAETLGRELVELLPATMSESEHQEIRDTIIAGHIWNKDVQCRRNNDELYWERMTFLPVINRHGTVTNYLKLAEDITAEKFAQLSENQYRQHLEDMVHTRTLDLENSRNEAQAASKAKTVFLSTVSHEIRTPMNAIMGFTHIFDRTNLSEIQKEQLGKIHLAAKTLLAVINDVLDISKIEAGKLELQCVPFSLRTSLETVRSIVAVSAQSKNLELLVDVDADVPDWVNGDVLRLNQILLNLLNNAIKFTPSGSIRLHVEKTPQTANAPAHELIFTVTDTGIGIPREQLPHLFQSFMQADSSISRRYGGTGLGLAISQQLVELMNGSIHVESQLGIGSTFRITVQLTPAIPASGEAMQHHSDDTGTPLAHKRLVGLSVLVVEDNLINQEIACALLEELGMVTARAENGYFALEMAQKQRYDCIFMDMQMPEMDGLEATARLRTLGQTSGHSWIGTVPIIAMTANAMAEDRARCLAAGMDDHIAKPIDPDVLEKTLHHWLTSH